MHKYYVYYLRRPDKEDPLEPGKWQPFYVGKGKGSRKNVHRKEAEKYIAGEVIEDSNFIKLNIIKKLKYKNLDFAETKEFIDLTEEEAFRLEKLIICIYGRIDMGTGCLSNMTDGGEGSSGISEETRRKMSESRSGENHWNYGKHHSPETREKIKVGNQNRDYVCTEEIRKKISDHLPDMTGENHHMYGKHHSPETREKISKSLIGNQRALGHKHTEESRIKMSKSQQGRRHKEESKQKNRKAALDWWAEHREEMSGENAAWYGRKHTEETKEKMKFAWVCRRWDKLISNYVNNITTTYYMERA